MERRIIGKITDIFSSAAEEPVPKLSAMTGIQMSESSNLAVGVGLKVLERLASALKIDFPKLKAAYGSARKVRLNVEQPERLAIDATVVSQFLDAVESVNAG